MWWLCENVDDMNWFVIYWNAIDDDDSDDMIKLVMGEYLSTRRMIIPCNLVIQWWFMVVKWSLVIDNRDDDDAMIVVMIWIDWNAINDDTMMMSDDFDEIIKLMTGEYLPAHGMIVLDYFVIWCCSMVMIWSWLLVI